MKKIAFLLGLLVMSFGISLVSCSDDDDKVSELEKKYLTVPEGKYVEGNFPRATISETIDGLSINKQALSGGMNFITVVTEKSYKRFFVGVKGVDGYWEYIPQAEKRSKSSGEYKSYIVPVNYSTDFSSDINMLISAEEEDGDITTPYEAEIDYVESKSGDLNINLTFSNEKDVDLHLYMPDGEHIYYGHRGGYLEAEDGSEIEYGLDHDSNAGCSIDGLNNENIFIPSELIQPGTYRVVVDMFSNCDPEIPTSWSIVARYKGEPVVNEIGGNPVTGYYPEGAGDRDMTTVMTFSINEKPRSRGLVVKNVREKSVTDMDLVKMAEAEITGK